MSQEKEAQIKFYKTREDKEIEKVIALENKVKALDDIVYKTGQSVQTMNMLNRNCKTSFVKPEFLKKAQRANPRLYDIGCYNDNLALMLAPESDETIRLAQESRSKLSDLIKPFDYKNLNNLYDLFVPQREKSSEQRYFSERSKMSHTPVKNENSKESFNKQTTLLEKRMDESIPEYYYADHMNAILGVYTTLDEFTDLQCDYVDQVVKCERLEKELSKRMDNILPQNVKLILKNINMIALRMYKVHTKPNKTRTPQFPQDIRKTNKRVSFSTGVISTTSVSRPQLKRNRLEDRVMHNNSEGRKQQVEDHHRNFKTKMPMVVPISTREPKRTVNQSSATPLKRIVVAESTKQKLRSIIMKQYEQISKTRKWWYCKITPPGYKWKPKSRTVNVEPNVSMPLGTKSRTTNISEPTTLRKSTVSNTLSSSNSFKARRDNFIHRRLWVHKAHDGQSQGSRGIDLYSITLQDTSNPNLICLMAKATSSQAWLWHSRLSHLNFDTINLLSKYEIVTGLPKLKFVKDHLCSSCELRKAKQDFMLKRNRTLVEAARTMLSAAKVPLFFWAEAIATACFTQNRSLLISRHEKTPYHIINGRKPSVKFFHIFGSLYYIVRDGENLDKMKEKGDACIFVGYSTQSRVYRVYNKRTRVIVKTIYVNFDELPQMASYHISFDHVLKCPTTALEQVSLSPGPQSQENVPQTAETVTMSNELDLLFSLMFDELLNGTTQVVSKSSAVTTADAPNQRQQQHTTPATLTTITADTPSLNIHTTPDTTSQV
ncbi:retrovirus-related pol polyprotein from transposon TNT 1-94 [Tanacetum coccineum]